MTGVRPRSNAQSQLCKALACKAIVASWRREKRRSRDMTNETPLNTCFISTTSTVRVLRYVCGTASWSSSELRQDMLMTSMIWTSPDHVKIPCAMSYIYRGTRRCVTSDLRQACYIASLHNRNRMKSSSARAYSRHGIASNVRAEAQRTRSISCLHNSNYVKLRNARLYLQCSTKYSVRSEIRQASNITCPHSLNYIKSSGATTYLWYRIASIVKNEAIQAGGIVCLHNLTYVEIQRARLSLSHGTRANIKDEATLADEMRSQPCGAHRCKGD